MTKINLTLVILVLIAVLFCGCTEQIAKTPVVDKINYSYNKLTDTYAVSGISIAAGKNVVIPDTVNGKSVTAIWGVDAMFNSLSNLETVILPDTIERIGSSVYAEAPKGLKFNEYDNGLYLGTADNPYFAFIKPKYIEAVEKMSYILDGGVNDVIKGMEDSMPYDVWGSDITSCVIHPDTKIMADQAFSGCHKLKSIVIPGGIKRIPEYAFAGCDSLENVIIEEGVEVIGEDAFVNCYSLASLSLPSTLKEAKRIVTYWTDATVTLEVILADGMEAIPNGIFSCCTTLKSIVIPDSVKRIGNEAFEYCIALEYIKMSENIEYIGDSAFSDCSSLTSISLSNTLKEISPFAFYNSQVEEIIYDGSVEEWNALYGNYYGNWDFIVTCNDGVFESK